MNSPSEQPTPRSEQSDTPRTDAKQEETREGTCLPKCDSFAHEEMCPYCNPDNVAFAFARDLERELSRLRTELEAKDKTLLGEAKLTGTYIQVVQKHEATIEQLRRELALRDAREEELKQSLEVLTNSEQMWMEQCSDAQTRLVSMEAVVERAVAKARHMESHITSDLHGILTSEQAKGVTEKFSELEKVLVVTPDQSLLESLRKEIEGLKEKLAVFENSFETCENGHEAQSECYGCQRDEALSRVELYATAARVIALHLESFCDESLPYDQMISDASRKAASELTSLRSQLAEAQEKLAWKPISVPPNEYETVLTIHEKDLFPVCAFRIHHGGRDIWLRQIEGPEDEEHEVKNEELTRPPTHWMPLPNPPLQAIRSASQE